MRISRCCPFKWIVVGACLVVQVEDGVEARCHVEVVLAAMLAQPLLAQPRLLHHNQCCQLSAGFFRPVRRKKSAVGGKWNFHFCVTFSIEKNNSEKKKCHKSSIYMPREYTDKKENKIFLIYEEIQKGAVAKSYLTKSLLCIW